MIYTRTLKLWYAEVYEKSIKGIKTYSRRLLRTVNMQYLKLRKQKSK